MKRKILFLILLGALLLTGCEKASLSASETAAPAAAIAPAALPTAAVHLLTLPTSPAAAEAALSAAASAPQKAVPPSGAAVPAEAPKGTVPPSGAAVPAEAPKEAVPPSGTAVPAEAPKVSIVKNPTGESVTEGGSAVFIARADHAEEIVWIAVSPNARTAYELDAAPAAFEGLKVEGLGTEKLTLRNIPCAMDGWRIQCYFTGNGGPAYTKGAYLTVEKAAVKADSGSFEGIVAQYQAAIQGKCDAGRMMELGLNGMIPECLKQDERARVGYSILDLDGDGQMELVISASSESEYYTGLLFAAYIMENGEPQLLLESGERNRWYCAGDGRLLNIASSSASESGWYLCKAGRELAYLDAIEYNAGERPDDPWLEFTGETWERITQESAEQRIMELTSLVSNIEMTAFQSQV